MASEGTFILADIEGFKAYCEEAAVKPVNG